MQKLLSVYAEEFNHKHSFTKTTVENAEKYGKKIYMLG